MSEKMTPLSYGELMGRLRAEYEREGTIFGVRRIYRAPAGRYLPIFGERIETPFGPAAGPNTQLAENIIAAYAAGARFFELKTVQIMDGEELARCIGRPCILARDEGYNCEWSTELTVEQALDEYRKAHRAIREIAAEYGLGAPDGFVFNMSVGYDLAGIKSPKIDAFIEGMRDISSSITLSTLHGCPPEEIERIAAYLIGEKGLNTYVKCNPTLLGYDWARKTLDALGWDEVAFGDFHFRDDLQWADAVPMLRRLQALAAEKGVEFGVKLTNTFPVDVKRGELPSQEMYMSGRSLFPLTAELARRVTEEFGGALRISYSGGADEHSAARLFAAGVWPVTMATNLLKPGGYNRLMQLAAGMEESPYAPFSGVDAQKISALAAEALADRYYRKAIKPAPSRKMAAKVPLTDCFYAPCRDGCPIHQDIPAYVRLLGEGRYLDALRVITARNPLPNITGTICSHRCMDKCVRNYYEGAVDICGCKLAATEAAYDELLAAITPPESIGKTAAVVGAGPAGLAAAYFLRRAGWDVTVFEREQSAGGVVKNVIPDFRISPLAVERDAALCRALGVKFVFGREIRSEAELAGFGAALLCIGAGEKGALKLEYGESVNVIDFLRAFKSAPESLRLGKNVAVVGGGNSAMDAARAALKVEGVERVSLVYRRDARNMPADEDELNEALAEGVKMCDLSAPIGLREGFLDCERMVLGDYDASGRRSPEGTGERVRVPADTVIAAVGERVDAALYRALGLDLDSRGRAVYSRETQQSSRRGVYLCGDGAGGPSTVVEAIAAAARAARDICGQGYEDYVNLNVAPDRAPAFTRKGVICHGCPESERCLECATVCEQCVDVCPNRANIAVELDGRLQIIHLDRLCNECGNCAVFCPYDSAPYKEKLTLFSSVEDFESSENTGFVRLDGLAVRVRWLGETFECDLGEGNGPLTVELAALMRAVLLRYAELFI